MDNAAYMCVDEGTSIGGRIHLVNEKGTSLTIGKDCMFSSDIIIWGTDGHTIYSSSSSCLNAMKKGISIGNHVWIGNRVTILKDVSIPNNCVIGAASVVTHSFLEENIIIAGNPAKKVKGNINWKREYPKSL